VRLSAIFAGLCLAVLLAPVALNAYPPFVDYPNHLARLFILANPGDPVLSRYYRIEWALIPNLGFDLIGLALAQIMPVETAGRVFVGLVIAVSFSAPMALHRALYGRISVLPLLAGPLVFHRALQMGFLSFSLGLGLAIWGVALWHGLRGLGPWVRFALVQAMALVLFICHLYALGIFAVFVLLSAISTAWRGGAIRAALPEALAFLLPFILLLAGPSGDGTGAIVFRGPAEKLAMLALALLPGLSVAHFVLALAALSPVILARPWGGRMVHPAMRWPLAALFLLYWLLPDRLMTSQNADWRLIAPLGLVLAAAAEGPMGRPRTAIALGLAAVILNTGAAILADRAWRASDQVFGDLATVLERLPEGRELVPYPTRAAITTAFQPPAALHAAAYAVTARRAPVPTVFAHRGQQPIELAAPGRALWQDWLAQGANRSPDAGLLTASDGYVLAIRAAGERPEATALPVDGETVSESGRFTLYRLRR